MIRRMLALSLCGFLVGTEATAGGLPVYDGAANVKRTLQHLENVRQTLVQLEQYAAQIKELETQINTYTPAVKKYEAMIGEYGFGGMLNRELDKEWRRYFPGKFSGDLTDLNHIRNMRSLVEAIQRDLGAETKRLLEEMEQASSVGAATKRSADTAIAADALSQGTYEAAVHRLQNYETLMRKIDETPNLKASADLQNRIQIENGYVLNQIAQLQAMGNQLAAKIEQERASSIAAEAKINSYRPSTLSDIPTR